MTSATGVTEEAVLFGDAEGLVGIVTLPAGSDDRASLPAVVILNAGEVHRAGPNRLYVSMARRLAAMGFVVLRFDFSWIDWHEPETEHRAASAKETVQALDLLAARYGRERFVLTGICSGGDTALGAACADARVVGVAAINAMAFQETMAEAADLSRVHEHVSRRKALRYYFREALFDPKSWAKLVRGRSAYGRILSLFASRAGEMAGVRRTTAGSGAGPAAAAFSGLASRGARLLFVCSEGDPSADYLEASLGSELKGLEQSGALQKTIIGNSDHIFTLLSSRERFLDCVCGWMQRLGAAA